MPEKITPGAQKLKMTCLQHGKNVIILALMANYTQLQAGNRDRLLFLTLTFNPVLNRQIGKY